MIMIEQEPFSKTEWYAGVYRDDANMDYEFTIAIIRSELQGNTVQEVMWTDADEGPGIEVENDIWDNWEQYINKNEADENY